MFDEDAKTMIKELEDMWQGIDPVSAEAERCQKHRKDENTCVKVVCAILGIVGMGSKDDVLEMNSVYPPSVY